MKSLVRVAGSEETGRLVADEKDARKKERKREKAGCVRIFLRLLRSAPLFRAAKISRLRRG